MHALSHPLWWVALGILVVNDHVLKASGLLDAAWTGKLSDLAGLVVAPMLLASLLRVRRTYALLVCHLAVATVFAAINLVPAAASLWTDAFAVVGIPWRVWSDPTDLLALPALLLSFSVLVPAAERARPVRASTRCIQRAALMFGALACIASSPWPVARPTVVDSRVLVEDPRGVMIVVDADSGAIVKTLKATGYNEAPPAIHDHILYQVQLDGRVTGIHIDNPQTPFTLWRGPHEDASLRILAVDAHRVYVAVDDENLHAIDRVNGTEVWTLPAETRHVDTLAIEGDTMVVSGGERVQAVDVRTGRMLWTFDAGDSVGVARIADGTAYLLSDEGVVHGLALSSGREVWRYDADDGCDMYAARALVGDGAVFVCVDDGVQAVGIQSVKRAWSREGIPVGYDGGVVVLRTSEETFEGVDAKTGRSLWTRALDESVWMPPTVANGAVYARTAMGRLYAIDVKTGALRWSADPERTALIVRGAVSLVL